MWRLCRITQSQKQACLPLHKQTLSSFCSRALSTLPGSSCPLCCLHAPFLLLLTLLRACAIRHCVAVWLTSRAKMLPSHEPLTHPVCLSFTSCASHSFCVPVIHSLCLQLLPRGLHPFQFCAALIARHPSCSSPTSCSSPLQTRTR